jgi:hypothetical protein
VYQDFPRLVYVPRQTARLAAKAIADKVLGAKKKEDRQVLYLEALEKLGELGADIREFPMVCPDEGVLRSFVNIIGAKLTTQEREMWLANNAGKTPDDYKKWVITPDHKEVKNAQELKQALADGWYPTPDCKPVAA